MPATRRLRPGTRGHAAEVARRLEAEYGRPRLGRDRRRVRPVDELVLTILSQNTNDRNRDVAYARLRERFPRWEQVLDAEVRAIQAAIRPAGLHQQKARRIKRVLRRIVEEQGALSLAFLRRLPVVESKAWLTHLDGVGPKTAACVLLFSLDRPAFPVDTHIERVGSRLGFYRASTASHEMHRVMEARFDPAEYFAVHTNLIRHGRTVCKPRPRCPECVLNEICPARQQFDRARRSGAGPARRT